MREQVEQFATVRSNISQILGGDAAAETLIQKSLFIFSVGSNDIFDFFFPPNISHTEQELQGYMTSLMYNYQIHLKVCSCLLSLFFFFSIIFSFNDRMTKIIINNYYNYWILFKKSLLYMLKSLVYCMDYQLIYLKVYVCLPSFSPPL